MSEWVQIISSVGFPIAAFMMLAFYIYKVQSDFQKVIENNTLVLTKLCEKLNAADVKVTHEDDNK